ncbi:putative regulator of Ras-like GTPase activity (Roadblock/LC7/MglB family) [Kibdelosporangium banguiense]|uniref:Regulator of Ras-like GTPase activity (Roadblock/LC7/MglB family) n=1 Tax=Kibdelosporangium banguiense TaxID=1365924 RepID=A0ABS4TWW3_9PSEU|nr:roadblock/LC7 domain-containing protein [Kibdelosporangium banguiense]MBP2328858.1 putative regulator of Ras-like GTPase activity (Roadblock/LC7/MglB family) [Kibdelosporangium banguiense]
MTRPITDNRLGFLLDRTLQGVSGVKHGVLFTDDGLLKAYSTGLHRDEAERLAASLTAQAALARQDGEHYFGWQQSVIEYNSGYVVLAPAALNTRLGFITTPEVSLGDLTLKLAELVQRVGEELASEPRQDIGSSA